MVRLTEAGLLDSAKIVTFNSISAEATSTDHGPHCISRAALAMMTRLFADRLGEHGIGVFEVRMGLISAGADDPAHAGYDQLIDEGLTPIRRWGRPEDVARAVAAIAEDLLSFSTGEVLHVDGGFHLRRL
jgi:NAD(P)-dependent dehydrogenase (short-subunit alcohol dehydrogenase family)